jgi:hypothetical protein
VGQVEFFEVLERGEASNAGESIRLDGDDAEVREGVEVLG